MRSTKNAYYKRGVKVKIQSICETMAKGACLIFADCVLADIDPFLAVQKFNELVERRIIQDDCFVNDHEALIYFLSGKHFKYKRVEMPPKDKPYIARYVFGNNSHFVVCENGRIIFDSLNDSKCAKYGKPTDFRVVE